MIELAADNWLGGMIGAQAWRVAGTAVRAEQDQVRALLAPLAEQPSFAYARVPTRDVTTVQCLEAGGMRLVDTNVTLEVAAIADVGANLALARAARPDDANAVEHVARTSFEMSRFHLDPLLAPGLADEIKARWAANFFRGQRGDFMVVAEHEGQVAGFLQLLLTHDGVLVIDLIAVLAQSRGRGLGAAMIAYAAHHCGSPKRFRVGTQVANATSLALYQKMGFRVAQSAYMLHMHGRAGGAA